MPTAPVSLRQRQLRTRAALTSRARRLTADSGLSGFTVQQLCDEVGISRRTFFNYFPTKESAVLGIDNGVDEALLDDFLAARLLAPPLRRHLIDDLVDVAVAHVEAIGPRASDVDDLVKAVQREPRLISALVRSGRAEHRRFVDLVAGSSSEQDPAMAEIAVVIFESLVRSSVDTYLRDPNTLPFSDLLHRRVDAARDLFSPASTITLEPAT